MIKIIYLKHSGFVVELEMTYLVFDYYTGELPKFNDEKNIIIFVSHKHQDHYNRDIWELRNKYKKVTYVISKDIPFSVGQRLKLGIKEEDLKSIYRVKPDEEITISLNPKLMVTTLRSTDEGVAFVVSCEGKLIYHAGDLNLWCWKEETPEYNEAMKKKYLLEMEKLRGKDFDVAFIPLDPRQEEDAYLGLDTFLSYTTAKNVVPMHVWEKYDIIDAYRRDRGELLKNINLIKLSKNLETVSITC